METQQKKNNHSFLMQGMILAAAGIITRLIGIAYRIPLNNILGDEGQGFYGCAFSIYNIALLLTSYSLPLAVSKLVSARVAKGEHKNALRILKGALIFAIIAGALAGGIVYIFGDFIAGKIMSLQLSVYALKVLAPGLFIVAIMGVLRGYYQGLGTMVPTAVSQIIEQIINAIVSVTGAYYLLRMGKELAASAKNPSLPYAYGAAGGTLGTVSGALAGLIFLLLLMKVYQPILKRHIHRDSHQEQESYREIFTILMLTIAPVILSTAIYNISETLDQGIFSNIMVAQGHTEKETAELLGMFTGKYNTLINIPLAVANALGASLIPSLTATISTGTKKQIHSKIHMVIRFAMLIAIPSCVGFLVLGKPILALLYTGNIDIPAKMLQLGAITVIFYCLSTVTNSILQGLNQMTTPVKHGAISLCIHLVGLVIMLTVFHWGIYAVIIGNIIFSLSMCILNSRALSKASGYRQEYMHTFVLPLLSASCMGVVSLVAFWGFQKFLPYKVTTVLVLCIAVAVYGISLIKFGALTAQEIQMLPKGNQILHLLRKLHLLSTEE